MAGNKSLGDAKAAKNDEFYTRYEDIEAEMNAYYEYDNDVFRGKTVLLPCDDPEWSEFTRYFASNFDRFGLKKLISTSYAKSAGSRQLTLFEEESPLFDEDKHDTHGKLFVIERRDGDTKPIDTDNIEFRGYLEGDGDFRSREVTKLRDESDIIITNPPFSLLREFFAWIMRGEKRFVILGSMNAITYKEIFPYLKDNLVWLGYKSLNSDMYFTVTEEYQHWLVENKKEGSAYKVINGIVMGRLASACWFTNIDHGKRHELLSLDTMAHNLKFNKKLRKKFLDEYGKLEYPHYDNYDAIEVTDRQTDSLKSATASWECRSLSSTNITPSSSASSDLLLETSEDLPESNPIQEKTDHTSMESCGMAGFSSRRCNGVMGVPITFLDRYNPEQFEIINLSRYLSDSRGMTKKFVDTYYAQGNRGQISEGHPDLCFYGFNGKAVVPYMRILIRHRRKENEN